MVVVDGEKDLMSRTNKRAIMLRGGAAVPFLKTGIQARALPVKRSFNTLTLQKTAHVSPKKITVLSSKLNTQKSLVRYENTAPAETCELLSNLSTLTLCHIVAV